MATLPKPTAITASDPLRDGASREALGEDMPEDSPDRIAREADAADAVHDLPATTPPPSLGLYLGRPIQGVAEATKPPETAPLSQEDWDGMAVEDRVKALRMLQEDLDETTRGVQVQIPRIKYPSSGTMFFEIPDATGEPEPVKVLECVVLTKAACRVYYPVTDDNPKSGEIPTCMSADCETADKESVQIQSPTGKCEDCPHSQWGSGKKGEGQACKQRIRVYLALFNKIGDQVLLDEIPTFISLPPTSIKPFGTYVVQMRKKQQALPAYKTLMSLTKTTSKGGMDFSGLEIRNGEKLPWAQYQQAKAMISEYEKIMRWQGGKALAADIAAEGGGSVDETDGIL